MPKHYPTPPPAPAPKAKRPTRPKKDVGFDDINTEDAAGKSLGEKGVGWGP